MAQFMNKKQLSVTIILICLMGVLVGAEKMFNNKIKLVALMNNNISELKSYEILDGKYKYDIPEGWQMKEKSYPGDYIIHSTEFLSDEMGIIGYVQVINTSKTIQSIVSEDKNILKPEKVAGYTISEQKIKNREVQKVQYEDKSNDKNIYINVSYYMDLPEGKVCKITFDCDKNKYKENYESVFKVIIESFKVL